MPARPAAGLAILAVSGALALGFGAASASAAELPEGDGIFAVATDEGLFQLWQLLEVDPATAEATLVGASTTAPSGESQVQGAYDPATGTAYFVGLAGGEFLYTIDLETGEAVEVGPIRVDPDGANLPVSVTALAIGSGSVAFAVTESDELYSIDLTTGEAVYVADYTPHFHAFAYDAVTDAFYGLTSSGDLFSLNTTDGSTTIVTTVTYPDVDYYYPYSLQFDSVGALWVLLNGDIGDDDALYSFTLSDTTLVPSGALSFGGDTFNSLALLIAPVAVEPEEPTLAATGPAEASIIVFTAGGLAAAIGIGLIIARRNQAA